MSESRGERAKGWKPLCEGISVEIGIAPKSNIRADIERGRLIALEEATKWSNPLRKKPADWWHEKQNEVMSKARPQSHAQRSPRRESRRRAATAGDTAAEEEAAALAMQFLPLLRTRFTPEVKPITTDSTTDPANAVRTHTVAVDTEAVVEQAAGAAPLNLIDEDAQQEQADERKETSANDFHRASLAAGDVFRSNAQSATAEHVPENTQPHHDDSQLMSPIGLTEDRIHPQKVESRSEAEFLTASAGVRDASGEVLAGVSGGVGGMKEDDWMSKAKHVVATTVGAAAFLNPIMLLPHVDCEQSLAATEEDIQQEQVKQVPFKLDFSAQVLDANMHAEVQMAVAEALPDSPQHESSLNDADTGVVAMGEEDCAKQAPGTDGGGGDVPKAAAGVAVENKEAWKVQMARGLAHFRSLAAKRSRAGSPLSAHAKQQDQEDAAGIGALEEHDANDNGASLTLDRTLDIGLEVGRGTIDAHGDHAPVGGAVGEHDGDLVLASGSCAPQQSVLFGEGAYASGYPPPYQAGMEHAEHKAKRWATALTSAAHGAPRAQAGSGDDSAREDAGAHVTKSDTSGVLSMLDILYMDACAEAAR